MLKYPVILGQNYTVNTLIIYYILVKSPILPNTCFIIVYIFFYGRRARCKNFFLTGVERGKSIFGTANTIILLLLIKNNFNYSLVN